MQETLIFDIGCHIGEDSEFYLRKGFRVVAVEANPALCAELRQKFSAQIVEGRFVLVEKAIASAQGEVDFFVNDITIWGTIDHKWAKRHNNLHNKTVVPAIAFSSLLKEFGIPYYMKIDIEGADLLCLKDLIDFKERPPFISFEHDKGLMAIFSEMSLLKRLGYTKVNIVDQSTVENQKPPFPAREGIYVDTQLKYMASGLFGRELPGRWCSRNEATLSLIKIYVGDRLRAVADRIPLIKQFTHYLLGPRRSWYDIHAQFCDGMLSTTNLELR